MPPRNTSPGPVAIGLLLVAVGMFSVVMCGWYLVDPDAPQNRLMAESLVAMIIPASLISELISAPLMGLGRSIIPIWLRWIAAAGLWVWASHELLQLVPSIYHLGRTDIVTPHFQWLWLSLAAWGGVVGPVFAEFGFRRLEIARNRRKRFAELAEKSEQARHDADKMMAELRDQRAKLDLAEDERERAEALRNYMRG